MYVGGTCTWVFPINANVIIILHSNSENILYFVLHYISFTALVTNYFTDEDITSKTYDKLIK